MLTAFACDGLCIGVTVIVVSSPFASTIGIALINVLLLPSTPSNSVVSTVADKDAPKNFPNFFAELKPARPITPSS